MNWLRKRPWLIVVAFFLGFIAWWIFFITLAVKNQPDTVPLPPRPLSQTHAND